MGGVPTFGSATATGRFTKWTGRFGAKCSYGSGASISVLGERLGEGGTTMSSMNDVGCIEWSGRGVIWKGYGASRRKKGIGEPDAGNPHVRFDEGRQETCVRVARLSPTLQSPQEMNAPFLSVRFGSSVPLTFEFCTFDRAMSPPSTS